MVCNSQGRARLHMCPRVLLRLYYSLDKNVSRLSRTNLTRCPFRTYFFLPTARSVSGVTSRLHHRRIRKMNGFDVTQPERCLSMVR